MADIPALSQSMVETAACPRAYQEIYVKGNKTPQSLASERGHEVHEIMAAYVQHCAQHGIGADWAYFNNLARSAGPDAGPILDGLRDNYEVPHKYVYATETLLLLDENLDPAQSGITREGEMWVKAMPGVQYSEEPAAFSGILDVILLNDDQTHAKINDYKTHPQPFEADTFQSVLYSFMLFKHIPTLRTVKFELNFVRYRKSLRSTTWSREDMPAMQAQIERARTRQIAVHENPDDAQAIPCGSCVYCPMSKNLTCPISDWNEHTALTDVQRLMSLEFYRRMTAIHKPILKAHVAVDGPVKYRDGNDVWHYAEYGEVEERRYPADVAALQILGQWKEATGEDLLDGRLNFSSTKLKGLLKAKKRATLKEMFEESVIESGSKPKFVFRNSRGETYEEDNSWRDEG